MPEDKTVGYYCHRCRKSVECKVVVSNRLVTTQSPHRVVVEVDARCPNCEAYLASGKGFIELC